jgi:hypothetical protein
MGQPSEERRPMDSTLIFRNDDGTTNTWQCRDLGLDRLAVDEYNSLLGEAYLFWSDFVHPATAFDFDAIRRAQGDNGRARLSNPALATVFRANCGSDNPFDFTVEMPTRNDTPIRVGDLSPEHVRRLVALDLNYAKGNRKPLYQHIKQEIDGRARECYRLLLPVLGTTSEIAEIFGFCRSEATAHPVTALRSRRNKDSVNDG